MTILQTPAPYYDRFTQSTAVPPWVRILANKSRPLQSAEFNEMQSMSLYQLQQVADSIYDDGTFTDGGDVTITQSDSQAQAVIAAGTLYAWGLTHNIPAATVNITGVGEEIIYLVVTDNVITSAQDATLFDPARGSEAFGRAGADRLTLSYQYVLGGSAGIHIATIQDGQVVHVQGSKSLYDRILNMIEQRTYDEFGSFFAIRPSLLMEDLQTPDQNPGQMRLTLTGGNGYVQGVEYVNNGKLPLPVRRTLDTAVQANEGHQFLTGVTIYNLDEPPLVSTTSLLAVVESGAISITRGGAIDTADAIPIPSPGTSVVSIIAVNQGGTWGGTSFSGGTTYTAGTDYSLVTNNVSWIHGGSQPSPGTTYNVVIEYSSLLAKAVRTYTTITAESHTVSGGTITLSHTDLALDLVTATSSGGTVHYVEGTDFTVNRPGGVITWLSAPSGGTAVSWNYHYWTHTTEGDYVVRDSFVDSSGNLMRYVTPVKTINGHTIDFNTQMCFETSTSIVPVVNSTFFITYSFAMSRIDIAALKVDGTWRVIEGVPGISPAAPEFGNDTLPITKIILPPECFASDALYEYYDNLVMRVTEQRAVYRQVRDLQLDVAQLALLQETISLSTATAPLGIFTDDLSTPDKTDVSHPDFNGTFDLLAQTFSLPRTEQSLTPTPTTSGNTLLNDMYMTSYTEGASIQQIYSSGTLIINQFGGINLNAKVTLDKPVTNVIVTTAVTTTTLVETRLHARGYFRHLPVLHHLAAHTSISVQVGVYPKITTIEPNVLKIPVISSAQGTNSRDPIIATTSEWVEAASASSSLRVSQVSMGVVASQVKTVVTSQCPSSTINVTGSHFLANERAISATFNGTAIALTPTGSTVAETDSTFPGCVKANSSGAFTASLTIPSGIPQGTYALEFIGHDPTNLGRITSYVSVDFTGNTTVEELAEYITRVSIPPRWNRQNIIAYVLCQSLGIGVPTIAILNSLGGPWAFTVAYAVVECGRRGISINHTQIKTAVDAILAYTTMVTVSDTIITNVVNAIDITAIDAVEIGNTMIAVHPVCKNAIQTTVLAVVDPLAQTFTLNADSFITSIDLFFNTAPASGTPVTVAIAPTTAGIPTTNYLAMSFLDGSAVSTSALTKFTFDKPVFLSGGVEYAFVVMTQDVTASLKSAVLGGKDPVNGLITKNPSSGACLQSPNGSTWQLLAGQDLKFNVNVAAFSASQSILNFGAITFSTPICIFSFYGPFAEPSQDTQVVYQYSLNGTQWTDFPPMVEVDLGVAVSTLYLRQLLNGTSSLSPTVTNTFQLLGYLWGGSGAYVAEQFGLNSAEAEYTDVWLDTDIPGSTSITPKVNLDGGGLVTLSEVTADAQVIDANWTLRHYTHDTGGSLKQNTRLEVFLASSVNTVTPRIRRVRCISR